MTEITKERIGEIKELLKKKIEFAITEKMHSLEKELEEKLQVYDYLEEFANKYRIYKISIGKDYDYYVETSLAEFIKKASYEQFTIFRDIWDELPDDLHKYFKFYMEIYDLTYYFSLFGVYIFKTKNGV